ncbi:hypothetical protein CgunFtcFv8_001146 [Champsocephalus gunnari]|uniref:Uncharacterized protein n=1 Tax=Champsocephalus gunnari TaxID=52237 RepID=A0AAN8DK09_CHAGU|nr:hypothetical protein CgunFtcFv8_001146 [Champsocephalus gunnari]
MDVTSHRRGSDTTEGGANKNAVQSECISSQPTANGTLPHPNTGVDVGSISPPPVCTPPSSSFSSPPPHLPPPLSSTCNRLSCSIPLIVIDTIIIILIDKAPMRNDSPPRKATHQ